MSRFRGNPADSVWYVHAPTKKEKRELVEAPPPSQIPYLNGVMDTSEDTNKKSEVWFKETDSPFVRLSKIGGREGEISFIKFFLKENNNNYIIVIVNFLLKRFANS